MAQLILGRLGKAVAGRVGQTIGRRIGKRINQGLINALKPAIEANDQSSLSLNGGADGDDMAMVFGEGRVSAVVIWAARFKEWRHTKSATKTSPAREGVRYSLSFALGLCEGSIDAIGRIWADGQILNLDSLNYRLYRGTRDQMPDPLMVAIEGDAPAYRGHAYLVFEDFDLTPYGNRLPQFSVEIKRRPKGAEADLESLIKSICLIPGTGEFSLSLKPVAERVGLSQARYLNLNGPDGRADMALALDQMTTSLPNLEEVNLVVSWFGTDLRASHAQFWPGVETRSRQLLSRHDWQVNEHDRQNAHLISLIEETDQPVYGGTPDDETVIDLILALKSRGLKVNLLPFILMDIAPQSQANDPYGASFQAAYPWRGRMTASVAPGLIGSPDQSLTINSEIAALMGNAKAIDFVVNNGSIHYQGPPDHGLARMILHQAAIAKAAGGVNGFVMGSELRGLTTLRSVDGSYPFVDALRRLALEVRHLIGSEARLTYGADWSEYFGHHPKDNSHDVRFHLDPLWADPAISCVGIDWYAPLTDWRDTDQQLDGQIWPKGLEDPDYFRAMINGGEGYDYFYASDAHRHQQQRTPIVDTAYDEDWVFRPKDMRSWWQNQHFDRLNGIKQAIPTDWIPQSKPIWLVELGCGAIDKGSNTPNRFLDPKSSESSLPYFSNGQRDDQVQYRTLMTYLKAFDDEDLNPISTLYDGPMILKPSLWAYDGRPYPYFPALLAVWADGGNWRTGHWLNGRLGLGQAKNCVHEILDRAQISLHDRLLDGLWGSIAGLVLKGPYRAISLLEIITTALGLKLSVRNHKLSLAYTWPDRMEIGPDDLIEATQGAGALKNLSQPRSVQITALDQERDYQTLSVRLRGDDRGQIEDQAQCTDDYNLSLPLVMTRNDAINLAHNLWREMQINQESISLSLDPLKAYALEAGDEIIGIVSAVSPQTAEPRIWEVVEIDYENLALTLRPKAPLRQISAPSLINPVTSAIQSEPIITRAALIDIPPMGHEDEIEGPILMACAHPMADAEIWVGPSPASLRLGGLMDALVGYGCLIEPPLSSCPHHIHRADSMIIKIEGVELQSKDWELLRHGHNRLLLQHNDLSWEVMQFQSAELISAHQYRLSGLIRGQWGTQSSLESSVSAGAEIWLLEANPARAKLAEAESEDRLLWRFGPKGGGGAAQGAIDIQSHYLGFGSRPLSPVHLRLKGRYGGVMRLEWRRHGRIKADGFDLEPAWGHDAPLFRLEIRRASSVKFMIETPNHYWDFTPDQIQDSLPNGLIMGDEIHVRALSWRQAPSLPAIVSLTD